MSLVLSAPVPEEPGLESQTPFDDDKQTHYAGIKEDRMVSS